MDVSVNSTTRGALPDWTSIEKEADGGSGVGAGIGVDAGVAVSGIGVAVGGVVEIEPGLAVATGSSMELADEGLSGKDMTTGVSDVSAGIMKSHAGRMATVSTMNIRQVNGVCLTF